MFENNMKSTVNVLFVVIICIAQVYGQACPQTLNAAHMCVPGVYTGERVFIDTTTYNTLVDNCSCTFTTTSNVLKLVTYVAPNYAECNSAIRLQSESGNNMRFECLISGTYLDTSMFKTGEATFEKYADYYDNNYCLMLEVAGQPTDSVTVTCTADIPLGLLDMTSTQTSSPNVDITSMDTISTTSTNGVFKPESTTNIPELTTLPDTPLIVKNEPVLRSTETTVTNPSGQVDVSTVKDIVANESVDVVDKNNITDQTNVAKAKYSTTPTNESSVSNDTNMWEPNVQPVLNVQGLSNSNDITTLDLVQQTTEASLPVTTISNTESSTTKDQIITDPAPLIPIVEVNYNMTEQQTDPTVTLGTTQDVLSNTNEFTETANLTEAKISAIVESLYFTSSPHATNESEAHTNAMNNDTIIPDSSMTTPIVVNENITSDNFSVPATGVISNSTIVSETARITTETPTSGTNVVTAIVTGTVLFNSGGENSSKVIQTIDNVPNYILGDAPNKTDTQITQPTSNYDITFGSNNAEKPYRKTMFDISSPSSSLFSENIAPVTPPTDLSNTLILIPEQLDAISNTTVNGTLDQYGNYSLNFPTVDPFVEADTANISFIDNNAPLESSPFTASEPRIVTENAEPLNPIAMLTETTMSNVLTNVTGQSTGELDHLNVSTTNASSNLTSSTLGLTEAPIITDVNTDSAADTLWNTAPGFDNTVSPFVVTGTTPLYETSSSPKETASLSTQAQSSTTTITSIQAETLSTFDMHNNFPDTDMVLSTNSKTSQITNNTSSETTSVQTPTENYFLTNESLNEPFVNNSSVELNDNFQNPDMKLSTESNISDNTTNISSKTSSTHTPTENYLLNNEGVNNNFQDVGMVQSTESKLSDATNKASTETTTVQVPTENYFITNEPFVSNPSVDLNNNFQDAGMATKTDSQLSEVTNTVSSATTSANTPTENSFLTNEGLTEPLVNSSSFDLNNNFQDTGKVVSTDSKLPEVINNVTSETTSTQIPTENFFITNEGLNNNFQDTGMALSSDSMISDVTNKASSETTTTQVPTENYFLSNEGLNEPFVNNAPLDLNNAFQDTGMMLSTDSNIPNSTAHASSATTSAQIPIENYFLTNEGLNNNFQNAAMEASTDSKLSEVTNNVSSETTTSQHTDSKLSEVTNTVSSASTSATTHTENYFLSNEGLTDPLVNNSSFDLNNNFQDTGMAMSTDSKLPGVTNNVYPAETTTTQIPTENYFLTNQGLNNNFQDVGMEASTDSKLPEVTTNASSETTTIQVPTENYFLSNEGLNEPLVNNSSFDLNNNFQDTGIITSTDSKLTDITNDVISETTSAQTPTDNYFLSNGEVGEPFVDTYSTVSTNTVNSVPNNENKAVDTLSFGEPPKRIHVSEYMNSNLSSSNIEQVSLNSDVLGNQTETTTTTSSITDQLSLGKSSSSVNTPDPINSNVSDTAIEQSTDFWNLLGGQNETVKDGGAVTVDQMSFGEPPKGVHISEYVNNNMAESNVEHTTVHWNSLDIQNETVTADQMSFSGPPEGVHLSEYVNSNMSDATVENTTVNGGYFQGDQVAPTMAAAFGNTEFINVGTQTDTFADAGAVTSDQISFGEPPKGVHISEYVHNNMADSIAEQTTSSSNLQENQTTTAVTDAGSVTPDQISFGEPPKGVHISEYINNNISDSNADQTTSGSNLQGSETSASVTDVGAATADQISFGEPPKGVHISEYINNIMSNSNVEQTTTGAVTDVDAVTSDQLSFGEPPKRVHISEYTSNNSLETTTELTINSGGLQGEQVDSSAGNTDILNVSPIFAQETTTTSSVDSGIQSTANIISEEIVPIENIPNESIVPITNANLEANKDAAMAANILADIEQLMLQENSSVVNQTSPIEPTVPGGTEKQLDSNMLQSAVNILSEIEKQVIMDIESTTANSIIRDQTTQTEATSTSVPDATSDIVTGASTDTPTGPIENLAEPAPIENIDWSVDESMINSNADNAYSNVPTTPRQKSFNIVEETMVVTEGPSHVDIGKSKSGDKEMNVSFDKESRGSPLDVNNNTYIIVVGIIAGLVVLATVIGIICHNKRKRRSEKVNISGTNIDPASHQNRAFDNEATDAEQGTSVAENTSESSPSNGENGHLPPKAQEY